MKKKYCIAVIEIVFFSLAIILMAHSGVGVQLTLPIFAIGMLLIGIHINYSIIIPNIKAQEDLKIAAEKSKQADILRKEFVANVSHELKTPLTSITGFIETLQDGAAEDPEIRTKFIDIIAIETSRLKRLIEDLLVLSDIENKKEMPESSQIDVEGVIRGTAESLIPIARNKRVEIIIDCDQNLGIYGSSDRFSQLLVNLMENAIKYSNDGGRVWVCAKSKGEQMEVSVKDEGIGIKNEHLERLFERFYRVDKSRSTKAGGTGLGLSIVKHIAALFEADLRVESTVGEGTIFYVTFER
ncbi:MAG: ATP-binding protein [Anaerovoracaceae bacterium]